ncbi:MAG: nuclease [Candidatus Thiodiazotropha sp. (ex Dulcina madagascariensis)]|nr:nuclease [Candidatus Thiodiazotropha sp. (ex Dulcina madagascariensis)]
MKQDVSILIDDREMRSGIVDLLYAADEFSISIRRLEVGDYEVDGRFLVERKTLYDLTMSIMDGRLFRQACKLAQAPLQGLMILEGTSRDLTASAMRREAIQGALITLAVYFGIPLLRSRDAQETVRLMSYLARQGRAFVTGALPRRGKRPRGKLSAQLHILQGLPGVGPERARHLLEAFGSVEAVIRATEEALIAVDGVGPATAEAIFWAIHEPASTYGTVGHGVDPQASLA